MDGTVQVWSVEDASMVSSYSLGQEVRFSCSPSSVSGCYMNAKLMCTGKLCVVSHE